MKNLSSSNVQTVVLVLNMQEGMCKESKQIGNDSSIPKDNRQWLQRKENEAAENRKGFFNDLAEDIQGFLNKMRNYGAHIVWGLSDEKFNERLGNIYHGMSANEKMDSFLTKTDESAYKENVEFFEKLKRDAEADGKTLEIKVCGSWVDCVADTVIDLSKAGYDVQIVRNLVLHGSETSVSSNQRKSAYTGFIIERTGEDTGKGTKISETAGGILAEQRNIVCQNSSFSMFHLLD